MYKHHKFLGKRQAALAAALVLSMGVCGTAWASVTNGTIYQKTDNTWSKSDSNSSDLGGSSSGNTGGTYCIVAGSKGIVEIDDGLQIRSSSTDKADGLLYVVGKNIKISGIILRSMSSATVNLYSTLNAYNAGVLILGTARDDSGAFATESITVTTRATEASTESGYPLYGAYNNKGSITLNAANVTFDVQAEGGTSVYGTNGSVTINADNVKYDIASSGSGTAYGMSDGTINASESVAITASSASGTAYGMSGGTINGGKSIAITASSASGTAYGVYTTDSTMNIGTAVDGAAYENKITISATAGATAQGGTVYATGANAVINVGNDASTVEITYDTSKATGSDSGHYTAGVYSRTNASTTVLGQKISITSTSSLERITGVFSYDHASLTIGNANTEEITISVTKTSSSSHYATAVRAFTANLSMTGKEIALSSTVTSDASAYGVICGSAESNNGYQVTINSDATNINASAQGGLAKGVWDNSNCGISIYGTALSIDAKSESNAAYAAIAEGNATIYLGAADSNAIAENSSLTISAVSSSSSQDAKYLAAGLYASGSGAVTAAAANNTITATNVASEADGIRADTSGTVNYYGSALEITATSDYISHAIHALGKEDEESDTGYSGGTINVGSEESGFDTVIFNASGTEASGVVAEKSGSVSVYGSGSDASSIVISAASTGGDADTQGLHADTTGSIIIGSTGEDADAGFGAIAVKATGGENATGTVTGALAENDGSISFGGSGLQVDATGGAATYALHADGVEDEDSETGYSGGGTINVGSEESGFDTVIFNASGAEASGVVAEKSGTVSVYGSGSDASSIVICAASTGGDADTQGLHADTTGSIIIGSTGEDADAGFGAIAVKATGGENATGAFAENQGSISISGGDLTVSGDTRGLASETQGTINVEVTDAVITSEGAGVYAANGTYDEEAPADAASVTITTENKLVITGGESAVEANSNGQVNLNGNVELTGEDAITAGGNATVNVNTDSEKAGTTKVTGDVVFQSDGTSDIVNAYVDLSLAGGESSWNGSSYIDTADGSSIDLEGGVTDFNVSIADGASWTTTGDSFVNNLTLDDGSLTTDHTVNIGNMTMDDGTLNIGTSGYVTVENMDGTTGGEVNIEATSELESGVLIVKSNTSDATMNFDVYYQGITADNIQTQDDLDGLVSGSVKIAGDANIDAHLTVSEGIVSGEITADIENSLEGGSTSSFERAEGSTKAMQAIGAVSGAAIIAWREEDATLSQRLGELREAQGGQGIWARMSRGEFKNNGTAENQYNLFQLGYDFGADAWHYGFAVSHNDGESAYEIGRGDNKSTSLSVYGTWLGNKGHYLDVVAKAGRLSTDYDLAIASGSVHGAYKTTGLALSGEYGRRLEFTGDWYVTPLAKLSLMRVEGKDYTTSNGVEIDQEALTSALGRVGVEFGKKFAGQGSFYLKASYLHEFAGDAETVLSAGSLSNSYTQAIGSSWWEMGFGAHYRAADKTYIYADVIRTFGDDFSTPWQWNVGAYWNF